MKNRWFLIFFLALFPIFASAQSLPGISQPISITVTPPSPAPNETVELSAQSYSFDINSANVVWKQDGKVISEGVGDKTATINAGNLGSQTTISVTAQAPSVGTFSDSTVIAPGNVNLVWEADTYTPPFYSGKALHSWGSVYRVVALPEIYENGIKVDPSNLVYTWKKDYSVDPNQSGYGRNVYTSDGSINYAEGSDVISLNVATKDDVVSAENSITVPNVTTGLLVYNESPIYGILYNQSITNTTLVDGSITLHVEPFFFSSLSDALSNLTWTMNGTPVTAFAGNPSLTLVRQDNNAGTASVEASTQSQINLLQGGTGSVTININAK